MKKIIYFALFIILSSAPLLAQDQESKDKATEIETEEPEFFTNFVKNHKEYHNNIRFKAERIFRLTYENCENNLAYSYPIQQILIDPVERDVNNFNVKQVDIDSGEEFPDGFDEEPKEDTNNNDAPPAPIYGQWIERLLVQGCDQTLPVNLLIIAYEGKNPVILPLINGKTQLDPIDQPFVEKAIAERLVKQERPCELAPFVINTDLVGYRSASGSGLIPKDEGYGWFEKWTVRACDRKFDANIAILPDPKTRYRYIARLKRTE